MITFNYVDESEHGLENLFKTHKEDAGLDIRSNEDTYIQPQSSILVKTGLYLQIKEGFVGLIWPRSGLSVKHKIEIGAGCIDASYRGEIKIHLYNYSNQIFIVNKGDRIAQLLTLPIYNGLYKRSEMLTETDRGKKGFGGTGIK
jgi:dUTP pyrophosphatase